MVGVTKPLTKRSREFLGIGGDIFLAIESFSDLHADVSNDGKLIGRRSSDTDVMLDYVCSGILSPILAGPEGEEG
jgi:hypothetical protein